MLYRQGTLMNQSDTPADLFNKIRESAGSIYLDRAHQRSFSLNVFKMNAVELIEAVQRVKDPDQGMALMMENNHEAGFQAHRELNRHVHNFVSSALALVEHTRVFMRKYYADTELFSVYEKHVIATFAQSPVAQFVQGLRNYMLHRGLPNSSMFLKFETSPGATDGSGMMKTSIQYDIASILDWKEWKQAARTYLESAGSHLDIHEFAQSYLVLVNQFHEWLDVALEEHHRLDLQELRQLQIQLQAFDRQTESPPSIRSIGFESVNSFEFNSEQSHELDQISLAIFAKIRELHFEVSLDQFPSERPVVPITDRDLIGPITAWGKEENGRAAVTFIQHEGKSYGLEESDYEALDSLTDSAMKVAWARGSLSRSFIEKTFFNWARERFLTNSMSFPDALGTQARESVKSVEVWAPIAHMEVEQAFVFGPTRIESLTAAKMENLRSRAPSPRPEQEQQVNDFFEKLKSEIQGYAVVVISMEAEPSFALERALQIAQDAVSLLSFFSPAAPRSYSFNPVALAGAEYIPKSKLIELHEGGLSHVEAILPKHVGHWRLSTQRILELKSGLLNAAASLVVVEGLSEFPLAVRASILTYGKGITLVSPLDRLRNCLSALEGILLKHDMEPRAHSIANRISFLLSSEEIPSDDIRKIVRQIYWLKDQPVRVEHGHRESELIATFTIYAYKVLYIALSNSQNFVSKVQFVAEIDRAGRSP